MGSEWPKVKIEDIKSETDGAIAIGPFGSRMKSDCYVDNGIPVIRGTNITGGNVLGGNFVYITEKMANTLGSCNVYKNDLVFPHRGSIGEVGIILDDQRYVISSSLMKLTCNILRVNPKFLYYFFKSPVGKYQLLKNASQVGTPGIGQPLRSLKGIELSLPPLELQNSIDGILSALDAKIELNQQMNETLESMAQSLFKSWFVDFDPVIDNALAAGNPIPEPLRARAEARRGLGHKCKQLPEEIQRKFPTIFVFTEEMGWIPEGWEVKMLSDLTTELRRGISPKYIENGGVRVINQKCIRKHAINFEPSRRNDHSQRKVEGRLVEEGDVLVNSTGVGTLGRIAQIFYLDEPTVVDSHVTVVRPNSSLYCPYTFGRMMLSNEITIESLGKGSTGQTELSRTDLGKLPVILPHLGVQKAAEDSFQNFASQIAFNTKQNSTLITLRDTLLPKLLSGKLRLPDSLIEKFAEEPNSSDIEQLIAEAS